MQRLAVITNASKANIIATVNALLQLLFEFGVDITDGQKTAIVLLVNTVLVLWIGLTYDLSAKRVSDS
jgi:hypothetical protein